jgi:hypothetical protein
MIAVAAAPLHAQGILANWSVDEEPLARDQIRLRLAMNRIHAGGAGEARLYFLRRAEQIARDSGYREAQVLHYAEGIDSRLPFAQRYAEGVIRLIP